MSENQKNVVNDQKSVVNDEVKFDHLISASSEIVSRLQIISAEIDTLLDKFAGGERLKPTKEDCHANYTFGVPPIKFVADNHMEMHRYIDSILASLFRINDIVGLK